MPPDYITSNASSSDEPAQRQQKKSKQMSKQKLSKQNSNHKEVMLKNNPDAKSYTLQHKDHTGIIEKSGKIVKITTTQFQPENVSIFEGESITFQLHQDAEPLINNQIVQVGQSSGKIFPVFGGFNSGTILQSTQTWVQEFQLANEYYFKFATHKPVKISVRPKPVTEIPITDDGFTKPHVKIYKGDAIRWSWMDSIIPRSVTEVKYCLHHAGYMPIEKKDNKSISKEGALLKTFMDPGMYYFITEIEGSKQHTGVVQVLEKKREHLIKLNKDGFSCAIFDMCCIERLWIQWDCGKALSRHYIQIKTLSQLDMSSETVIEDKSAQPSASGLFSFVFTKVGIYELLDSENTDFRCTLLVKPVKHQHVVRLSKNEFSPGLLILL